LEMPGIPELRVAGVDLATASTLITHGGYQLAPEVVRALWEQSAGNPLALLELPAGLDPDQRAGRRPLADHLTVTESIERAFLARIERLDQEGRGALLLAAANDGDDVQSVRRAAPSAAGGLDQAERAGLVRIQQDRIWFWHPLVRSAVYSAATDEERRAAHRALAGGLTEADSARRAWHLVASGIEPDDGVARDLARAGLTARRRGACVAAARLLERSATATSDDELRAQRLLAAGEAFWLAGQPQHAAALLDRGEALTRDCELAADITIARWWVATTASSPQALFGPLIEAAERLAADHPRKAAMMFAVAWDWACSRLDIGGARALADRAHALVPAQAGPEDREVLTALAWQRLIDCRVDDALRAARLAIVASEGQADLQVAYACEVLSAADRLDEAQAALATSILELRRVGHMPALCYALRTRATIELRQGLLMQALKTGSEALALAQEGRASWPGWTIAQVAAIEASIGLDAPCREHVGYVQQRFGGTDRWVAAEADAALGLLDLGLGNDDAALIALDRADRLMAPVRHPGFVRLAADRIETLARVGDDKGAEAALADLERRSAAAPFPWGRHVVVRARVLLAPAERLDTAIEEVLDVPTRSRFEAARTQLVCGERLRRAGKRVQARERLRDALATFHALGAEPWERRARTELRASGGRLRRKDASVRDELTPQELQVALVVADGATNREAAARLFLSPKTIEVHLSRAYRKLDVRTRTELARRLALHGADPTASLLRTLNAVLCADSLSSAFDDEPPGGERRSRLPPPDLPEIRHTVVTNGGQVATLAGDSVLAVFGAPSAALRCAFEICATATGRAVSARAAIHVGEIERFSNGTVHGVAVQIAEQALKNAQPGEVLVTETLRDTLYGSSLAFSARGATTHGGIGSWRLYAARPE
jgi:DNA-binding CsgD family transcriptional regulator